MGYQSKTYSYSDEVVEAIEAQKALGISPDRYLWSLIFGEQKPSKRIDTAKLAEGLEMAAKLKAQGYESKGYTLPAPHERREKGTKR